MFDRIAYTEITAFITNQLPTGTTFALNEHDSSEQIFIPSQIARVQNIVPGDRVMVRAIPNKREGGAQWFAVFVSPLDVRPVEIAAAPERRDPARDNRINIYVVAKLLPELRAQGGILRHQSRKIVQQSIPE